MRMFQSCSAGRSKDNKSRLFLLKRARPGLSDDACTFPCGLYSKRDHQYFLHCGKAEALSWNEHEPNRTHFDGGRLFAEFRLLRAFLEHGPRAHWAVGNSVPRVGVGGALFRASREVAWTAYCAVSRFVWIDVAVRLAAGADVPGTGAVSQTALRGSFRPAVHLGVLSRGAPRAGGPAAATGFAGSRFRVSCDLEHSGVRGVRSLVCTQPDFPGRGEAPAQARTREHGLATAAAGATGAHEPVQRAGGTCFDRDRDGAGIRLGGPAHGPILVLRSEVCGHAVRALAVRALFPACANRDMAGGARFEAVHFQFRCGGAEFYGGEFVFVAQPPLFLGVIKPRHGNRSRRIESPDGARRGAREGVLQRRAGAPRGG